MKYFIYCRRSSEDESHQVQSLETQENMLLDYSKRHELEIIEVIKESKSAKTDGNRPLFSSMLRRIGSKEAEGILVLHTDRLSRNGTESALIVKLFESGFLKEIRTPSRVYSSVADILYMDFDFVFASHYSRQLGQRIREGNVTKRKKGEYVGSPPLGYEYVKGKIIQDPLRAKYISKAFELYQTGQYSLKQICEILYQDGLRSRLKGVRVPKSSIHTVLLNPVYYGVIRDSGGLRIGIHKPLTTKPIFDNVQLVLQGKNRSKTRTHSFLYKNYLSCAKCGCKLTATQKKDRYDYYYCTNGRGKCEENKKYFTKTDIYNLMLKVIQNITPHKNLADIAFDIYKEKSMNEQKEGVSQKEVMEKQMVNIEVKLERLLDAYLNGNITEEVFKDKQKELQNEKSSLEIAIFQSKEQNPEITLELLESFKNQACQLEEMFENGDDEVRENLLKSVLWNLKIEKRNIASIQYKRPYAFLEKVAKNPKIETWLGSLDSNQNKQLQRLLSYH